MCTNDRKESNIHEWIKSVTAVVQSVAVACGVFFGISQLRTSAVDLSLKAAEQKRQIMETTLRAADEAESERAPVDQWLEKVRRAKPGSVESEDQMEDTVNDFVSDTKTFRNHIESINSAIQFGTMTGDGLPRRFCEAVGEFNDITDSFMNLSGISPKYDLFIALADFGEYNSIKSECKKRGFLG